MKLFDIRRGPGEQEWGVFAFGYPIIRKLIKYKMECNGIDDFGIIPDDIVIRQMDIQSIKLVNNMRYQVYRFYKGNQDKFYGLIAYCEGVPCGYVCGCKQFQRLNNIKEGNSTFYIKFVYVDSSYRGKHISMMLIQELARTIKSPLFLFCSVTNPPALKIYTRLGFKSISKSATLYVPFLAKSFMLQTEPFSQ